MPVRPAIIPNLVYADAPRAIDFLCTAFGFDRVMVVQGAQPDQVAHAQLNLSGSLVMLSSASPSTRELYGVVPPAETGNLVTGGLYVTLDDPDSHHARASAAGAAIVAPPHDNPYGGRSYEARDLEGNFWSFGSYDPWA